MVIIETPWTTCFLARMLILYLEGLGKDGAIDYKDILSGTDYSHINDPKAFLKDYNNWVPHHVLKRLIQAAEKAAGSKEVTYVAARNYFNLNHSNSLLEIIARLLNNMDQILLCSSLWAKGYTNYLRLQCLKPPVSDRSEVILLSQFGLKVEPMVGNINLIRGNYEGFIGLFDHITSATCTEELSQLKIETIIKEFKGYKIDEREDKLFISETISKKEVAIARKVYLKDEAVSCSSEDEVGSEGFVVDPKEGKVRILTPQIEEDPRHWKRENMAYEIISEGALQSGPLTYTLRQGQFFNAPYSRYRFEWESKKILKEPSEVTKAKSGIVPLLFKHLSHLRESHKRLLQCTIENKALAQANEDLKTTLQRESDFYGIIGKSPKMQKLFEQVRLIAQADSTILILGETGTGKELLAKAIHQLSYRKDQEFFALNCAAITESLLESELFGYEKGAFTGALFRKRGIFETANGGTLFLDEVGDISSAMQAKLLRVLEEHEIQRVGGREAIPIDVRVISATNSDLKDLVTSGKFRSDLFYRLNVIPLVVPPLRERLEDLPLLVDYYVTLFSKKCKKEKLAINREVLNILMSYPWPGNIRQLKNVIEHAVVLNRNQVIKSEDILLPEDDLELLDQKTGEPQNFHEAVKYFKRSVIVTALKKAGGNQTRAAKLLGIQRTYLARLIRLFKVPCP